MPLGFVACFKLGNRIFTSKKEITEYVGNILHSAKIGRPLIGDSFAIVRDLLNTHPEAAQKIGVGVKAIAVQNANRWRCRYFQIIRTDGTSTDFSFKKCICPPSQSRLFRDACRHLVADQIIDYRNAAFDAAGGIVVCPFRGTQLTPNTSHVDHVPPATFDNIVRRFIDEYAIDIVNVQLVGYRDNECVKGFADKDLQLSWLKFHATHAKLRIVSPRANLIDVKQAARIKPKEI